MQQRDASKPSVQRSHQEPHQGRASQELHPSDADAHRQTPAGVPAPNSNRINPLLSLPLQGTVHVRTNQDVHVRKIMFRFDDFTEIDAALVTPAVKLLVTVQS